MRINANKNSLQRFQVPTGNLGNLIRVTDFVDPSLYSLTTTEIGSTPTPTIEKLENSTLVVTVFLEMYASAAASSLTRSCPLVGLEYSTDGGTSWTRYDGPTDISGITNTAVSGTFNDRGLNAGTNKLFFVMENVAATEISFRVSAKKTNTNSVTVYMGLTFFVEEYYDDINNFGNDRDIAGFLGICGVDSYVNQSDHVVTWYNTSGLTIDTPPMIKEANTDVLVRFSIPVGCLSFNEVSNSTNSTTVRYYYSENGSNWISLGSSILGTNSTRMSYSCIATKQFKITNLSTPYIFFRFSIDRPTNNTTGANNITVGTGTGKFKSSIIMTEFKRETTPGVVNFRSKTRIEYSSSVYTGITSETDVFISSNMTITNGSSMLAEMNIGGYKAMASNFNGITQFSLYSSTDDGTSWILEGSSSHAVGTFLTNGGTTGRYNYNNQVLLKNIPSSQIKFKITATKFGTSTDGAEANNNGEIGIKYMTRMKFTEILKK